MWQGNYYKQIVCGARMESHGGRINVPVACGKAMRLLEDAGQDHEAVSARTGLGVKAVGIVADAVLLRGATSKKGWESLPNDAMFSLIKSECYPVPTRDTWIMARLLGDGAVGPDSAARMPEDRAMRGLVRSGHARRAAGGGFYLAGAGLSLAREVQETYPEIDWASFSRPGGVRHRARELVGATTGMRPPKPAAVNDGVPAQ